MGVVKRSDVLLEVVDARFPDIQRNHSIEEEVGKRGKGLVIVFNKTDLVGAGERKGLKAWAKGLESFSLSVKKRKGVAGLRAMLKRRGTEKGGIVVGVFGYPNTGKSSVINALKGRKVAPTAMRPGFTRGEKMVRLSEDVMLVDTPGVIPFGDMAEEELAILGAKDASKVGDAEAAAEKLVEHLREVKPSALKKLGVRGKGKDAGEILEEIAVKRGRLMKGGKGDVDAVARQLIREWQSGKL
jgi:ribosome biogenesis GTPase A